VKQGRLFWESLSFCSTPGEKDAICLMSRIPGVDALDAGDLTKAPQAYLRDVLARIADHPINRIDELLPWNIGGHHVEQRLAA